MSVEFHSFHCKTVTMFVVSLATFNFGDIIAFNTMVAVYAQYSIKVLCHVKGYMSLVSF